MILKHNFATEQEAIYLFKDTQNLSEFKRKLKKTSKALPVSNPIVWGRKLNQQDNENKILGNGFELFCELLVFHMGIHPHIGLANYEPTNPDEDEGIDAFAVNLHGERAAVQCKFVSDSTYEFTANGSNLTNFLISAGFNKIDYIEDSKVKRIFLITTANGLHYNTEKMWRNRLYIINNTALEQLVDNNKIFWTSCVKMLEEVNNG